MADKCLFRGKKIIVQSRLETGDKFKEGTKRGRQETQGLANGSNCVSETRGQRVRRDADCNWSLGSAQGEKVLI